MANYMYSLYQRRQAEMVTAAAQGLPLPYDSFNIWQPNPEVVCFLASPGEQSNYGACQGDVTGISLDAEDFRYVCAKHKALFDNV